MLITILEMLIRCKIIAVPHRMFGNFRFTGATAREWSVALVLRINNNNDDTYEGLRNWPASNYENGVVCEI